MSDAVRERSYAQLDKFGTYPGIAPAAPVDLRPDPASYADELRRPGPVLEPSPLFFQTRLAARGPEPTRDPPNPRRSEAGLTVSATSAYSGWPYSISAETSPDGENRDDQQHPGLVRS